jgi:hypothetical protein
MEDRRRRDDYSRRNHTMELFVEWRPWRRHTSDGTNDRDGRGQHFGDRDAGALSKAAEGLISRN